MMMKRRWKRRWARGERSKRREKKKTKRRGGRKRRRRRQRKNTKKKKKKKKQQQPWTIQEWKHVQWCSPRTVFNLTATRQVKPNPDPSTPRSQFGSPEHRQSFRTISPQGSADEPTKAAEPQGYGPDQHAAVAKEARSDSVGKLVVVTTVKVGEEGRGGGWGGVGWGGEGWGGWGLGGDWTTLACTFINVPTWQDCCGASVRIFSLFLTLSYSWKPS